VLRLSNEIRFNVLLIFFSLVFALVLIEISLSIFVPYTTPYNKNAVISAFKKGIDYDTRSLFQAYIEKREKGQDVVPFFSINGTTGAIPNKSTLLCNESGYFSSYLSDRHGFNNPDYEWNLSKNKWVLVGDSFTHGSCVNEGKDIASKIRTINENDQSVLNLGLSATGPLSYFAILKEYAYLVKPSKVFFIYYEGNDLDKNFQTDKNSAIISYLDEEFRNDWINKKETLNNILNNELSRLNNNYLQTTKNKKSFLLKFKRVLKFSYIRKFFQIDGTSVEQDVYIDPIFREILIKSRDFVNSWKGEFYFVYLPQFSRYTDGSINHDKYRKKEELINLVKSLDIDVIDIHKLVFLNSENPRNLFPFEIIGHYNVDGYDRVAQAIVNWINLKTR